jgi:hypothetical protein
VERYDSIDYGFLAKGGFLLGLGMLVLGAGGALVGHAFFEPLPGWEKTLFFDLEVLGLLIGFFSPLTFGLVLPLVE